MFGVLGRGVLAVVFSLLCLGASAQSVIRVTLQVPESHPIGQNWRAFQHIVDRETNGDVLLLMFPSGELFKDKEVPLAVGMGLVDAGSSLIGSYSDDVPAVDVMGLPFLFESPDHLARAAAPGSEVRRLLDAEILKSTGARVLWWQANGRNVYISRYGPIRWPDDMAGMRVRTYDRLHHPTVRALGGGAMLTTERQQYGVFQQQDVEVGMTAATTVLSERLYEVTDHLTVSYDSAMEYVAVINDEYFQSLPPAHQTAIILAGKTVEAQLRQETTQAEEEAVSALRSKMQVIDLTPAERDEWRRATSSTALAHIKKRGSLARKLYETIRQN
ncbi:MAG: TRAP transporter substrate-binding protein DctP [Pikeienuella sp.]